MKYVKNTKHIIISIVIYKTLKQKHKQKRIKLNT